MSASASVGKLFRQAANHIVGRLSYVDVETLDMIERRDIRELKRLTGEARLDIRDYEYADTRDEAARHATIARERLSKLRSAILRAGELGVFGAADIAQLSAQIDIATDKLQ